MSVTATTTLSAGESERLLACLPHKPPALVLSSIITINLDFDVPTVYAQCLITEKMCEGHFQAIQVLPSAVVVEALAQTVCVLLLVVPELKGHLPFFQGRREEYQFGNPVFPSDTLYTVAELTSLKTEEHGFTGFFTANAALDNRFDKRVLEIKHAEFVARPEKLVVRTLQMERSHRNVHQPEVTAS